MDNTIIQQGSFTSTGAAITIPLRSGVDWMRVYNQTALAQAAANLAYEFYWQFGMAQGTGLFWTKLGVVANDPVTVGQLAAPLGFTLVDTSVAIPGVANVVTGITVANPPVVAAATTPNIGDIIRLTNLDNQPQISGLDFTVTAINAGVSFTIGNINMLQSVASTAGFYRVIPYNPIFYPRRRSITWIGNAVNPKVYLSVTHGFTVGQEVRLVLPGGTQVWGQYGALDGMQATIIAVNQARAGTEPNNGGVANNIVLNIDTSAFAAWDAAATFGVAGRAYPSAATVPFTPAQIVPIGEDTAAALIAVPAVNILADATINQSLIGMNLAGGAASPGGANADVMYWVAGKSFSITNV